MSRLYANFEQVSIGVNTDSFPRMENMVPKSQDHQLSMRLIRNTFFVETGVNISLMFCLETLMVETYSMTGAYRKDAITFYKDLLTSNTVSNSITETINSFVTKRLQDSPVHLESILSILDGPFSFEICFFLAILDPEFRSEIRDHCEQLIPRYRGSLPEREAINLVTDILDAAEKAVFADTRYAGILNKEHFRELETGFKEYLRRFRDSSVKEIQEQKVRYNIAFEGGTHVAMPEEASEEHFNDWRTFCKFRYLSNKFSIFPELREHEISSLTKQESMFLPRPANISRLTDGKSLRIYDGIRYFRDRLNRPQAKCLNLHGQRGIGLSAFSRMLAVQLASAYSRGHSELLPIYIDLKGKTFAELNITAIIDSEILRGVDELTSSWQSASTVLILDNFDRVFFRNPHERERFLSSFIDTSQLLRKGGIVIVTDQSIASVKSGIDLENITLAPFDDGNIQDWFESWSDALQKPAIPYEDLSLELQQLFTVPGNLWVAINNCWDFLRKSPYVNASAFARALIASTIEQTSKHLLLSERKTVDHGSILQLAKEMAWLGFVKRNDISTKDIDALCEKLRLDISSASLAKLSSIHLFDISGNAKTHKVIIPDGLVSEYLVASRFIENVEKKQLLNLLGRRFTETIFKRILELIGLREENVESDQSLSEIKKIRETLWAWYSFSAVAIIPKRTTSVGIMFSDADHYTDFRLICLLLCADLTRSIGDERPLTFGAPRAISQLIKNLQSNPSSDRIDFRDHLSNSNLKGIIFEDIDLEEADFSNCKLNDARFHRCNMKRVKIDHSSIVGGSFENCQMDSISASGADLTGCIIRYCDLSNSNFRESKIDVSSFNYVSLKNSILIGVNLSKSTFAMTDFSNAKLVAGKFDRSRFESVDFSSAKLVGANFSNCEIFYCLFDKTIMLLSLLNGSKLHSVTLSSCDAAGIHANETNFTGLIAVSTSFIEGEFNRANFFEAKLRKSDFSYCDMTGSKLENADLREAIFTGAALSMANFVGATFSDAVGVDMIKSAEGADISNTTGLEVKGRMAFKKLGAKDATRITKYPGK